MRTRTNLPAGGFSDLGEEAELDQRQYISALARGLDVLRAFAPGVGPLGNVDIASKTGLPKPTVSRLTYTLAKQGYLEFLPKISKYQLGSGVLSLGFAFLSNLSVRQVARPHMLDLASTVDGSVSLGARERLSIVYVEVARGPGVMTLRLDVGTRLPIHSTASGLAFLAGLPEAEKRIIEAAIERRDENAWPSIRDTVDKAAVEVADRGFYVGLGSYERGFNSVAATFRTPDAQGYFTLNVSGPASEFPARRLYDDVGPKLVATISDIQDDWVRYSQTV